MFTRRFDELSASIQGCSYTSPTGSLTQDEALHIAHELLHDTKQQRGIVYVIGNGGSAGIASHFSNDLVKALKIPSQTLFDTNLLTCLANDLGYEHVFSYPLEQMIKPCDLLVAISSSGKSKSILNAVEVARTQETPVITLSGFASDNPLRTQGKLNVWIDRMDYGLVETAHFFILHTIVDLWNARHHAQIFRKLSAR